MRRSKKRSDVIIRYNTDSVFGGDIKLVLGALLSAHPIY